MGSPKHLIAAFLLLPFMVSAGMAQERDHELDRHRDGGGRSEWRGDIGRFHEHDFDLWRRGHWVHRRHDGRAGWWWVVGSAWYFYPSRVEPFPDPYQPAMVVVPQVPATQQYWYYCANPAGYYPYVAQCGANWQRVPATVPPPAPALLPPR